MSQANFADAVINTTSITKAFGDRVVVDHVDLKIRARDAFEQPPDGLYRERKLRYQLLKWNPLSHDWITWLGIARHPGRSAASSVLNASLATVDGIHRSNGRGPCRVAERSSRGHNHRFRQPAMD